MIGKLKLKVLQMKNIISVTCFESNMALIYYYECHFCVYILLYDILFSY